MANCSLLFDAANTYVEIADSAELDFPGNRMTIEVWLMANDAASFSCAAPE